MARPPDHGKFREWFIATQLTTLPLLIKDFVDGKLKDTEIFKSYRKTAKLVKTVVKPATVKPAIVLNDLECITSPFDSDSVANIIGRGDTVEGYVKLDLNDVIEIGSDMGLKGLLADLLIGTSGFKKLDVSIEYEFMGADTTGLYFKIMCYDLPDNAEDAQ